MDVDYVVLDGDTVGPVVVAGYSLGATTVVGVDVVTSNTGLGDRG